MIKNYNDFELQHSNTGSQLTMKQCLQNSEERAFPNENSTLKLSNIRIELSFSVIYLKIIYFPRTLPRKY